jgi:preprotein translocase subunit SecF
VLGTGPLKDLSLALFVGIAVGAYSSIFIAPALLALFKEREPGMQALSRRVNAKRTAGVPAESRVADGDLVPAASGASKVQDSPRATGSVPAPAARPMNAGGAGRPQPSRKPRSKRGK